MRHAHLPIVVVGGGVAGLATALAAAPTAVRLLCRAHDGSGSASALAQGGIAAAIDPHDSPAAHADDTLAAGAHHNDVAMVQWLTAEAPAAIAWLQAQGVLFDRDANGDLQLGREGGHSVARVAHAGGDASGAALVSALRARAQAAAHVQWRGGVDVDGLLMQRGRVVGVRTRDERGRHEQVEASAVVLATGGIGALFARTSNPSGADGAGLALGLAAGAATRDLEFVQFHPTALDVPGHCRPLITEALRGAGARLHDAKGNALMAGVHPLGDLAPRDVVSRRVAAVQATGGRVWLDATAVEGDWEQRFPTVLAACLAHGFDPRLAALPVMPVAHFHMGGLATDADGRTSVPGLFAVGEVACNGVHGANRLASNSLLEGVLCGHRLGKLLAHADTPIARHETVQLVERGESLAPAQLAALREWLSRAAGPVREAAALRDAWRACAALAEVGWQARLAQALLRDMRLRRHSLGAHWRQDRGCPH
ncbi:MAG: FAD-binding protein [Rhodanobacter sp.]